MRQFRHWPSGVRRRGLPLLLSVALLCSGCVSTYTGPEPDFDLKGAAAQAEIQKFTMSESFFANSNVLMTMGPDVQQYWVSSLKPVITKTSPATLALQKKGLAWNQVGNFSLYAALALLAVELIHNDSRLFSREQTIAYYSLLGISIGANTVGAVYATDAAEQFNRDLKAHFTPMVGMKIPLN